MKPLATPFALAVCVVAAACTALFGPEGKRVIGMIDGDGLGIDALVVPDAVQAGTRFNAIVSTFGSSCIDPDGAEVQVRAAQADIIPYDRLPPEGMYCTGDFRAFPRSVTLSLTVPGTVVVRLHGRSHAGLITLEETVTVVP